MKGRMFILVLMAGALLVLSCDEQDNRKNAFEIGYRQGYAAAIKKLDYQGKKFRTQLKERLSGKLIVFAGVTVVLTLFGASVTERLRNWLSRTFCWSKPFQVKVVLVIYLAVTGFIAGWTLYFHQFWEAVPVLLLLTGTVYPFIQYAEALHEGGQNQCRLYITKMKTLFFMAIVLLLLFRLLSGAGFMGITISG